MDVPSPTELVAALAAFVRQRLSLVPVTKTPELVITTAAAPFAPTSYARARLLRQMHAAGLLAAETDDCADAGGVPRAQ